MSHKGYHSTCKAECLCLQVFWCLEEREHIIPPIFLEEKLLPNASGAVYYPVTILVIYSSREGVWPREEEGVTIAACLYSSHLFSSSPRLSALVSSV